MYINPEVLRMKNRSFYQLDVKLPDHFHLQVEDVLVTGGPNDRGEKTTFKFSISQFSVQVRKLLN